jgi:hypothetical protein
MVILFLVCPKNGNFYVPNYCHYALSKTWDDAKTKCDQLGLRLAKISNQIELDTFKKTSNTTKFPSYAWVSIDMIANLINFFLKNFQFRLDLDTKT